MKQSAEQLGSFESTPLANGDILTPGADILINGSDLPTTDEANKTLVEAEAKKMVERPVTAQEKIESFTALSANLKVDFLSEQELLRADFID